MKKSIKLVMALFAVMLVSVTSAFAYSVNDLVVAANKGDFNTVKKCVEAGVDVNGSQTSGNNVGWTALAQAAYHGHTIIMKYLISKGAAVDRPINVSGVTATPIYYAAREGKLECVKILIYNGAGPNIKNSKSGKTALQIAQEKGFTNIVNFLKEQANKSTKPNVDAFIAAANRGDLANVEKQVSLGVDINAYGKDGWTALTFAAANGKTESVKYLISKKANLNKKAKGAEDGKYHGTALWYAAKSGHLDCVKALVQAGADINAICDGETPRSIADRFGRREVLQYLESKGAKWEFEL